MLFDRPHIQLRKYVQQEDLYVGHIGREYVGGVPVEKEIEMIVSEICSIH